jgi:GNAT superfamily N-acetyltransferase
MEVVVAAVSMKSTPFGAATIGDASSIVALIESAYRGETSRAGWTTEADLLEGQRTDLEEVTRLIADPSSVIILATSGEDLLGCVLVQDEGPCAYIGMLAIRPDLQARGLGRQLLAEAERCARARFHAMRTRMTVIVQREELIQWYERRGYFRTPHRLPFPYGNTRFGLPTRPDLEFLVLEKQLVAS